MGSVLGLWALSKMLGAAQTREDPNATAKEKSEVLIDLVGYGVFLLVALFMILAGL